MNPTAQHKMHMASPSDVQDLLNKIQALPDEKIAEVVDFVDFLHGRTQEHQDLTTVTKLAEQSFQQVWDNPDDAEYDQL